MVLWAKSVNFAVATLTIPNTMAKDNLYISVCYDMYTKFRQEDWELSEQIDEKSPFMFISGMGMALDEFERNLKDLPKGSGFNFTLTPEQAHGEYVDEAVRTLPRQAFERDGRLDTRLIYEGAIVPLENKEGEQFNCVITEITDTEVTVDLNHPLAGCLLRFEGRVLENHPATAEEMERMATQMTCEGCREGCGGDGCKGCKGL